MELFIDEGNHPCLLKIIGAQQLIANSTKLGKESGEQEAHIMLLTGPNMGGKSTLMRQVALLVIMAQLVSKHFRFSY